MRSNLYPAAILGCALLVLTPEPIAGKGVEATVDDLLVVDSANQYGGSGELVLDVSLDQSSNQGAYESVELIFLKRRFATAEVIQEPEPGCFTCRPIRLRWMHEPTGKLQLVIRLRRSSSQT